MYDLYKEFLDSFEREEFDAILKEFEEDEEVIRELYLDMKNDNEVIHTINEYMEYQKERVDKMYALAKIGYKNYLDAVKKNVRLQYELEKLEKKKTKSEKGKQTQEKEIEELQEQIAQNNALIKFELKPPVWKYDRAKNIQKLDDSPFEKIKRLEKELEEQKAEVKRLKKKYEPNQTITQEEYTAKMNGFDYQCLDKIQYGIPNYDWKDLEKMYNYLKNKEQLSVEEYKKYHVLKALKILKNK